MFEDELTVVEESLRGLAMARRGVSERGGRADERTLTQVLEATERLRRAADALELTVIGHAVRWGEECGADGTYRPVHLPEGEMAEFAAEAVGLAMRAGPWEAGERCDLAARAVTDLGPLTDLVADGLLRTRALGIVAKETREASRDAVEAVLDHLLAPLRGRPGTIRVVELEERELRKAIRRILQRVEPELLRQKAERNRREHLNVRFGEGPVGTADMSATLPTEIAVVLKEAIEQAGARLRDLDPSLTTGASRAHGLADLALRGVEVIANVRLGIPVITSAASRLSFAPYEGGELSFGAPSPPSGRPSEGTVQPSRIVTGEGPDRVDVLPEEWAGDAVTSQVPTTFGPGGQPGWVSGCDIPGIGYIPPDVVSAITTRLEAKVSRALLDARTGVLVETSNPRYFITDSMRDFISARDETCRMWGCNRRVTRSCSETNADLDHATSWPVGPSCPTNVSGLCRHHHRLKHTPGWTHTLHPDGRTEWVSPGGLPASTFPALWVHTEVDDGWDTDAGDSPPSQGANILTDLFAAAPPF
ncbi:hypothetical protein [Janibacter sp. GS2]|uniref:HNH endonuclease signature motif containing protein n=1 Tax=Janibacter sp. GS2 TaxID=3442646 RepID=UPI003EBFFB12